MDVRKVQSEPRPDRQIYYRFRKINLSLAGGRDSVVTNIQDESCYYWLGLFFSSLE